MIMRTFQVVFFCLLVFSVQLNSMKRPFEAKKPSLEKEEIVKGTVKRSIKRIRNKNANRLAIITKGVANGETPWWPRWGRS